MEHAHDSFGELENEDTKWVVVTNLDDSIDDYDIREKFEKFGHVPLIEVPYVVDVPTKNGSSWGRCARIKFALAPAARAACSKLGGRPWRGRRIQAYTFDRWLKMVDKNKLKNQKMIEVIVANKVFVGGLGPINAHTMRRYFQSYGPIDTRQSKIILERNGKSKGFGFVVFENPDSAKMVLTQQLHWIQGRQVNVGPVREKKYVPISAQEMKENERKEEKETPSTSSSGKKENEVAVGATVTAKVVAVPAAARRALHEVQEARIQEARAEVEAAVGVGAKVKERPKNQNRKKRLTLPYCQKQVKISNPR